MDKVCSFKIKGMQRDLSVSSFSAEYAYENMNIRIMPTNEQTLLSVVNEKGTKLCQFSLLGIPIGQATIDKYLIVFSYDKSSDKPDKITKISIDKSNGLDIDMDILYEGNLNFNPKCPIETLSFYENQKLMKVYWTDGLNQPRFINVASSEKIRNKWNDTSFDFVQTLKLKEKVTITKDTSEGQFDAGVIQYALTYFNKYGQESNIFYISPLYYISPYDSGGSPDKLIGNSFTIKISQCDTDFDYIRIYSIQRTTKDSSPIVKIVGDVLVQETSTFIDNGTKGENIEETRLLYVGGNKTKVGTISQKDNTLFLGDLSVEKEYNFQDIKDYFRTNTKNYSIKFINNKSTTIKIESPKEGGYYSYINQLKNNSRQIKTFKSNEWYRFGIQLQDKYGVWSDPILVKDVYNDKNIITTFYNDSPSYLPIAQLYISDLNNSKLSKLKEYVKIRPVVVFPTLSDREVICQGVLCPTVYSTQDRFSNAPFAQSSWFTRPNAPFDCNYGEVYKTDGSIQRDEKYIDNWLNINTDQYSAVPTIYSMAGIVSNSRTYFNIGGQKMYLDSINKGSWAEFRHNYPIPSSQRRNAEIQCLYSGEILSPLVNSDLDGYELQNYISEYNNYFYIDQSIVTLHSPDIEFDPSLQTMDLSNLKLRLIGIVPITANASDIDISASTPTQGDGFNMNNGDGFYKEDVSSQNVFYHSTPILNNADSYFGWRSLISGMFWLDFLTPKDGVDDEHKKQSYQRSFVVYPWHRNGSLNNAKYQRNGSKPSMLDKKKLINIKFSNNTQYFSTDNFTSVKYGIDITDSKVFNSNEITNVQLQGPDEIGKINYYGNIDKLITPPPHIKDLKISAFDGYQTKETKLDGYPIFCSDIKWLFDDYKDSAELNHWYFVNNVTGDTEYTDHYRGSYFYIYNLSNDYFEYTGLDPVRMKYKSSPHAVISINTRDGLQCVLPTINGMDIKSNYNDTYGWSFNDSVVPVNNVSKTYQDKKLFFNKEKTIKGVVQDIITLSQYGIRGQRYNTIGKGEGIEQGFLWLGELYRDKVNDRFGGDNEEALENNVWIPCGESVDLYEDGKFKNSLTLNFTEGDTYYQRYDHLKTYPFSSEDQNQVTEIISFMCETRINIDGRYDKNRGNINFSLTQDNFNKLNNVYSQSNNYFKYSSSNQNKLQINKFHNSITWTKTKTLGELVDSWANITLASTLDLDGDKGKVQALKRFNNTLFAFQDRGISQILYNENVLIASTQGVPIEIANSNKVSGKRYLTEVGCTNKWSICQTPNGLYFIDDITKGIYLFNGSIDNISDKLGFHSWINSESKSTEPWNPVDFGNFISYYDKVNGDVFFISKDKCLGFSEPLAQFASFYSYENTPYFANIEDNGLWIKQDGTIWLHLEGEYNNFFGEQKPFYTTIIANQEPQKDKTFNTLEFRADSFQDNRFITKVPFDSVEVWNEYQRGISYFNKSNKYAPHNPIKQKFRIWRANIPRSNENYRDRIRNPWIYLKLQNDGNDNNKVLLHDMMVYYFE